MPRKKGRGEGRWKSKITGKFVSAYYGKRNPTKAVRLDPPKKPEGGPMAARKYRKKPVVIEAERVPVYEEWDSTTAYLNRCIELADWSGGVSHMMINEEDDHGVPNHIAIQTLEGTMQARPGDFIIKGVSGEFYPCKPEIFEATYEPVED